MKGTIGLALLIVIGVIAFNVITKYTGYNGFLRKFMIAYEKYDIDEIVSSASGMYFENDGEWDLLESYFEDFVGDSLDSFESSVGHNYKLSYEVNETYNLSERKLEALIDELGSGYYDFDLSVIEKVVVADVTVTAKKGSRSSKQDMNIVMSKEDGEWKLVYIDNEWWTGGKK